MSDIIEGLEERIRCLEENNIGLKEAVRQLLSNSEPAMKKKAIFIVGGGPSLAGLSLSTLENKTTIAINKSIFDVPSPSHFITMDFTFLRKIANRSVEFQNIHTNKVFVANLEPSYMKDMRGRIVDTRSNMMYDLRDFNMIVKSYRMDGIGDSFQEFRTGENTGFCALQLAVLLGYKKIYLLGIDLSCTDKTHYHEGYPGQRVNRFKPKLDQYAQYFKVALKSLQKTRPDIRVFSCCSTSCLNEIINYVPYESILR
jgi:hypothetical protein